MHASVEDFNNINNMKLPTRSRYIRSQTPPHLTPHPAPQCLINIRPLRQRQLRRRLARGMHPIGLDPIALRVDPHARHHVVVLHIPLADTAAVPDGLNALLQAVGGDGAAGDGGLRDEEDGGLRDEGREHGAGDDGLDGGDGGVGVALFVW